MGYRELAMGTALLLGLSSAAIAGDKEKQWQPSVSASIGTSSEESNPFHVAVSASLLRHIGNGYALGIDSDLLIENKDSEIGYGLCLEKRMGRRMYDIGIGVSTISFDEPLHISDGPVSEPIAESAAHVSAGVAQDISSQTGLIFKYTRNLASQELFEHHYPKDRFSFGITYRF
ncbi:MAG: hypothetical protein ABIJ21_04600 [Nanoarchaeota archaeon]